MASTKKKKKDNTQLLIGLGAGAAIVVILIIAGVVTIAITRANQNEQAQVRPKVDLPPPAPVKPPPEKKAPPKDIGDKPRSEGTFYMRVNRVERLNELKQIGIFYTAYTTEFNRPPPSADDFVRYIQRDANAIAAAIKEKYFFIVPNVRSGIMAYEFNPDQNKMHGMVHTSEGVRDISTDDLVAVLRAQGN